MLTLLLLVLVLLALLVVLLSLVVLMLMLHGFTKYSTLVRTHAKSLAECSRLVIVIACKWDSSSLQVYLIDSETILQQHT